MTDGVHRRIVRRPPLGHVQATAHDMGREFRVMTALRDSDVPVPRTYAHSADPTVIGAEFYVMEHVAGTSYRSARELLPLGEDRTQHLATAMIDVLARLHAVEPESVGLGGLGRPAGFLARQVRRWGRQLEGSRTRELPDAEKLRAALADLVPTGTDDAATGVHGDYHLHNLLCAAGWEESVRAVIDWEMATLGDPLTDLALVLVYDELGRMDGGRDINDVSRAPGYPSVTEQLEHYAVASGRELRGMEFYLGLAYFKMAVILEGIHFRFLAGQTVGKGFDAIGRVVEPLLAAGLAALRGR
ncbi:phosphotransferase family protein [Amycolatopsis sp. NBC_01480]|uniref:phosphotransferase family protein n=1 Tax=Amycolatopsis sp. NBC_01480 TaxID=2903562 RepID=UPI002E29F62F|nr:phosphotransferase family protein [Amycolatopsis sp. NBC_01480]